MSTYGYLPPEYTKETPHSEPKKRRSLFLYGSLLLTTIIAGIGLLHTIVADPLPENPEAYDPKTLTVKPKTGFLHKIKSFVFTESLPETTLKGFAEDRINILLLGIGGPGHDGPYLSDTILLLSIRPSTKQVAFISIPRDLQVTVPGAGIKKINYANAYGEMKKPGTGGDIAAEVVSETLGVPVHYHATVDFTAFEEIIDHVGGITVQVDKTFSDPLFPAENDLYKTVSFTAGTHTFDGKTALTFARSRHGGNGEGSDFARSKRQQKVILALKEKILSFDALAHPVSLYNMMRSVQEHTETNMSFGDIISFARLGKTLETDNISRITLDDSPNGYLTNTTGADGAFYLVFKNGKKELLQKDINEIFAKEESVETIGLSAPEQEEPSPLPANIEIQNGTWQAGLAARLKDTLVQKKYTVTALGNTSAKPIAKSGIYAVSDKAPFTSLQSISNETHIPVLQALPTGTLYTTSTDILIILGDDWILTQ